MAVKRTGTIYTAKKLRLKQSPALNFFGKILETIGRPFFWLVLGLPYLFLFLFSFIKRVTPLIGTIVLWLLKELVSLFISLVQPLFQIKLPQIKLPRFPRLRKKWFLFLIALFTLLLFLFSFYWTILKDLPYPNKLVTRDQIVSTKIYDRHGELLYKIYRNQNRSLVPLEEIPLQMIQATIAIEDAEFYHHLGFSFKGIIRAFFKNLSGNKLYGGSTITQQLVKNALLTPERTFRRKIKEVLLALLVEQKFSKNEILQMYFNEVGYGGAAYGAKEAAQMYFGKSVRDVSLAEAALLAGLPASPTSHSPFGAHPEKAKERQTLVLNRMKEEGFITPQEAERARKQELHFSPQRTDIQAPHFVMYVKDLLVEKYGLRMVEEGGLEVKTSLDLKIQTMAQKIVSQEVNRLQSLRVTNGAALVTNPQTGEILAMVGSRDYFDLENDGNVNVTIRPRQPGSSIKPVMYSLALENGFTPATIISDTPVTYKLPGQPDYSPRNYDNRFHGNIPLRIALASSYNVPAVKVLAALGVKKMAERGQAMGITTWDDPSRFGLSLTLGGGEVTLYDMAVVYGSLANLGLRFDLNPLLEVKNYKGEVLEEHQEAQGKRILEPETAYLLTDILSDNVARTPAFGSHSILNISGHPHVAVKTGTTQNLRDNWTIGYTPDYLVGVWVGNNDNTPMSYIASGVTGASPIWQKIMTNLLKDKPDQEFPRPDGLKRVEICPLTNTLPCNGCGGQWEYFLPGTEPKTHCDPEKIKEKQEELSS